MDELTRARLLYDQTVLRLSNQKAVLDAIRARVGVLFGAALVATSFLGAAAKEGGSDIKLGWPGVAAMLAFGTVAVISAPMLATRNMRFGLQHEDRLTLDSGAAADGDTATRDDAGGEAATHRKVTRMLEAHYGSNYDQMKWMFIGMRLLPYVVAAELLLWVLEYSDLTRWQQGVLYALLGVLALCALPALWNERKRVIRWVVKRAKRERPRKPENDAKVEVA
jgi:hypothetical protein